MISLKLILKITIFIMTVMGLSLVLFPGCEAGVPLPAEQVKALCKECESKGMRAEVVENYKAEAIKVLCLKKW